jgi:hypothetical protein
MRLARWSAVWGTGLTAACVANLPPDPAVKVMPGKDKTEASFHEDHSIYRQLAIAQTGYGDLSQHPSGIAPEAPAPLIKSADFDDVSSMQCMAAGEVVQLTSMAGYDAGEACAAYPYPFGYAYPDGYPFAYPDFAEINGGFYDLGGGGLRHHRRYHAGFHVGLYGYRAGHAWGVGHAWGAGHAWGVGHAWGAGNGAGHGGGGGHR